MKIISHRRNLIHELNATPIHYGIEVDIRSIGDKLIIHHDAFHDGEIFEEWLQHYRHGTLILNVKEEGLESRLLSLMNKFNIQDFFFLDQSFPFLIKSARAGIRSCAVRVSEYESISTAMSLSGQIDWVWIDYFSRFPLTKNDAAELKKAGFKLCLVSPELQGFDAETHIPNLANEIYSLNMTVDAVCTKRPDLWEKVTLS